MKQKILHTASATGLTVTFEAPQGRPSSDGTVTLYNYRYLHTDTTNNPIVTGTATRVAVSTTLTAAAGVSQSNTRNVPCTPPAALNVGDFVILTNASSQSERSRVRSIGAAALEVEDSLQYDYATSDTIDSALMASPAIPDAFLQDEDNIGEDYSAVWVYTVNSIEYSATTRFDIVREAYSSRVRDSDLLEINPDLKRIISFQNRPGDLQQIIDGATKEVELDLIAANYDPDKIRGVEIVDRMVVKKTFELLARMGAHPNDVESDLYIEITEKDYERVRNQILDGKLKIPYDEDEDAVITTSERGVSQQRLRR